MSKLFIPNCVCVHTNKRSKTYLKGFLFCSWCMPLRATGGGVKNLKLPNMVMWDIELKELMSRTDASIISTIGSNW